MDFPFHYDERGHTAESDYEGHIRDLIHQVLFTNPGERVNRPDFGCGLTQLGQNGSRVPGWCNALDGEGLEAALPYVAT